MRKLLLSLVTLCAVPQLLSAQSTNIPDSCVKLAARGDIAELHQIYDTLQTSLPDYAEMYCRFAFARGNGNNREIADVIDSLETKFAQHFDIHGLLALSEEKCEALRQLGDYPALQVYSKERLTKFKDSDMAAERFANLKNYNKIATLFASRPCVEEEWGATSFAIPISRDWPLLVPASIGDNGDSPFFVDTSCQYSVISRDDAKEWGLALPSETVIIDTPIGQVKATPVIVSEFVIGALTVHHAMLFVVGNDVEPPYNRCLGNDLLRRLQKIEINDQQLIAVQLSNTAQPTATPGRQPKGHPICFNMWGGIDLERSTPNGFVRYSLDTSMPEDADEHDYRIKGVEFLKSANSVVIDFTKMRVIPNGGRSYAPRPVADYIEKEDYFDLLRNEAALYFTASDEELVQMEAVLDRALTPPALNTLSPTVRSVIITPEQAENLNKPAHQLMVTSQGLVYEKAEGKRLKTMLLTDKMATTHRIDIVNLKIY